MLLVLDIGNTRLKWAEFDNGSDRRPWHFLAEVEHFVERAGFRPRVQIGSSVAMSPISFPKSVSSGNLPPSGGTVQW